MLDLLQTFGSSPCLFLSLSFVLTLISLPLSSVSPSSLPPSLSLSSSSQVFSTTCPHSRSSFAPFISAAARFLSLPSPPRFVALARADPETVREYATGLSKVGRDSKPIGNLHACAFAVDESNIIGTLQSNFKCADLPRVYVIKKGVVEWDGHPCHVETAVAGMLGVYDTDSDEEE